MFVYGGDIAREMNSEVVDIHSKKIESLLTSFGRERQREGTTFGMSNDVVYHSRRFAFNSVQFLNDKFKPRKTKKDTMYIRHERAKSSKRELTTNSE